MKNRIRVNWLKIRGNPKMKWLLVLLLVIGITTVIVTKFRNVRPASAAWFNDSWGYRKSIIITDSAAETNKYATLANYDASDTSRYQADCGDVRFTDQNGKLLSYTLDTCDSTTNFHINMPSMINGTVTIYLYYGNPSATNGFVTVDPYGACATCSTGTPATEEKSPGPVAWWSFEEGQGTTITDGSSNKFIQTAAAANWADESMSISGKSFQVNNTSYLTGTNISLFNGLATMTISAWVKPNNLTAGYEVLGGKNDMPNGGGGGNTQNTFAVRTDTTTSEVRVYVASSITDVSNYYTTSGLGLAVNQWTHLVLVYDGTQGASNRVKIYKNGVPIGGTVTGTIPTSLTTSTSNFDIANDESPQASSFNGFVDEYKIYNYARSADQIKLNYNSGLARQSSAKGSGTVLGSVNPDIVGPVSNELAGYWKEDETASPAIDSSGNGNSGTWNGSATNAAGKFGNAISLDGNGDYVAITDPGTNSVFDFTTGNSISIFMWIKPTTLSAQVPGDCVQFINKGPVTSNNMNWGLQECNDDSKLTFVFSSSGSWKDFTSTSAILQTGVWQQIGVTYTFGDPTSAKIFYNGVQVTSSWTLGNGTEAPDVDDQPIWIGADNYVGGQAVDEEFQGGIDEVKLFRRTLSPAEVSQLYNWAPGPIHYWNLEEKTGSISYDTGSNPVNGTWAPSNGGSFSGLPGKVGTGMYFVSPDCVSCTNQITIGNAGLNGLGAVTMEYWYKKNHLDDGGTKSTDVFVGEEDSASSVFNLEPFSDGVVYAQISDGGSYTSGTFNLDDLQWHHLAMVFDGSQSGNNPAALKIYLDGKPQSLSFSGTIPSSVHLNDNSFHLSQSLAKSDWSRTLPGPAGYLDEVMVYNYARTQKQIVEDMNSSHPAVGSPVGSAAIYWDFDEGNGTTVNDKGYNKSNGTMVFGGDNSVNQIWRNDCKFNKCFAAWGSGGTDYNAAVGGDLALFSSLTQMTASVWIKPGTLTTDKAIVSKSDIQSDKSSATDASFWIGEDSTNSDEIRVYIASGATDVANYYKTSNLDLANGRWDHLVVVYDGTQTPDKRVTVYKNGFPVLGSVTGTIPASMVASSSTSSFMVGADDAPQVTNFLGNIDEFKLYTYPLTANEVKVEYNQGKSIVLGALSDTSGLTGGIVASNSASAEYCIPGDTTSCHPPVGEWKFENDSSTTAFDTSGNAKDATLTSAQLISGKVGKAYKLNGTSSSILFPSLGTITAFTMEFWLRHDGYTGAIEMIMEDGSAFSSPSLESNNPDSDTFDFYINNTDSKNINLPVGEWHHVALVYSDATNYMATYRDGLLINSFPTTETDTLSNTFYFGARLGSSLFAKISLDELKVFNYVRTPAQIAWDYNRGKPVASYDFDECQGTTLYDISKNGDNKPNGNNGTITITAAGGGSQNSAGTCTTVDTTTAWYNGRNGKYNSSLNFDGTNDYVSLGASTNLLRNVSASSISVWIKPNSTVSNQSTVDISVGTGTLSRFEIGSATDFYCGGRAGDGESYQESRTTSPSVVTGTWYHVVCVIDYANDSIKIYVDGVKRNTTGTPVFTATSTSDTSPQVVNMGIDAGGSTNPFTGQIDEVKIFNYPLTAAQVRNEYNQGSAVRFGPITGTP